MFCQSTLALVLSLAVVASAHVDINYPTSSWTTAAEGPTPQVDNICGSSATRSTPVSWGTQNPLVSVSGDAGHVLRISLATSNSTTENATVTDGSSFPILLAQNVTLPESGNLCLSLTLPSNSNFIAGARATLLVESQGEDEFDTACAEIVLVPADTASSPAFQHGEPVISQETGQELSLLVIVMEQRVSDLLPGSGVKSDSCPADQLSGANTSCAAGQSPTVTAASSPTSSATTSASSQSGATGSLGSAAVQSGTPTSGANVVQVKVATWLLILATFLSISCYF
ncbi:hypothetical protein ACM66B_002468 [Microbotryomycetes sp. NB124-2]